MKICHMISMKDIDSMGMITRDIYYSCKGDHIWCDIHNKPPKADIYILHCFKNMKHLNAFINFEKPKGSKVISLIHSSEPCMPAKCSDVVVTITKAWQERMKKYYDIDSVMIYPGIDIIDCNIDYTRKAIGHLQRPERGKYHTEWNYLILELLKEYEDLFFMIGSNGYKKLPIVDDHRVYYLEGLNIADDKKEFYERLSICAMMHETENKVFVDTFNVALLEAMSSGLACIIMGKYQEPMVEVLGDAGIVCNGVEEYKLKIRELIENESLRIELGNKAKERAKFFSKDKFVKEWDDLLCELHS